MDAVKFFGCYDYSEEWYLIEMLLDIPASEIEWSRILAPETGKPEGYWQAVYMEQYLNESGTEKICRTYYVPKEDVKPCRVAFFIFKVPPYTLTTPYGDFELGAAGEVPERLRNLVEFEEVD